MKKCTTCKIFKEVSLFSVDKSRHDNLCASCKECCSIRRKAHYEKNKEKTLEVNEQWKKNNKDAYRVSETKREKRRMENDLNFKMKKTLRIRISEIVRGQIKAGSAVNDLGCSIDFLIQYIESKFQPNMNWSNRGSGKEKWQLDHIVPLYKFDLTDRNQFLDACHYTNLQPLWHEDHLVKTKQDLRD